MNNSDQIESSLRLKLTEYVDQPHIHSQTAEAFYIWQDNPDSIIVYNEEDDIDDELFARFLDWFIFDFKTFDNNSRLIELYVKDSADNLSIEELNVLKEWKNSSRSYFEIKDIKPGEFCILSDIFSGEETVVHDAIVSSNLNLTDIICARPVKTQDKNFFFSLVSIYPLVFKPLIVEYFKINFNAYKIENGEHESQLNFLKDFGYLIGNHIDDVIKHPRYLTPEGEDFVIAKSEYSLTKRSKTIEIISKNKDFSLLNNTSDDLIIFRLNNLDGNEVDIHIEIEGNKMIVNCNSLNTLASAKFYLETLLKGFLKHKKDSSKNFNELSVKNESQTVKLPKGVRSRKQFNSELDQYYSKWIDTPLKQLDGLTPRKALLNPDSRKKLESVLIELELLYEDAKKAGEPYYEVNKLREELQKTMI